MIPDYFLAMKQKILSVLISILIIALAGCGLEPPTIKISVENNSRVVAVKVEIADTREKRERGLMYRAKLDGNKGMWFQFDAEEPQAFWMKNTLMPLDIMFFNGDGDIVKIIRNMESCKLEPCPYYSSEVPAKYALEVAAGFVERNSIEAGDRFIPK